LALPQLRHPAYTEALNATADAATGRFAVAIAGPQTTGAAASDERIDPRKHHWEIVLMKLSWSPLVAACVLLPGLTPAAEPMPTAAAQPIATSPAAESPMLQAPELPPQQQPTMPPPTQPPGPNSAAIPPAYDPETGEIAFDFAGLRLTQSRTDTEYQLNIDLRGLPPEQVQIRPTGRGLLLVVRRTTEMTREETFGDGRGYARSWGFSSGQRTKRLPAPPDADVRAMQREDGPEHIRVSIPRRENLPGPGTGFRPRGYGAPPQLTPAYPAPDMAPQPIPNSAEGTAQ
jgi:HSP20 family molecular chaperone IbpA